MSAIADAIEKLVLHCLNNLDTITVKRIRTRARGDLVIENGAGAWIKLIGDTVYMTGGGGGGGAAIFDRIYFGSDMQCWIERNPVNGNLTFHAAAGKGIEFERG